MKEGIKTGCLRCKSQITTNFKVNGWWPQKQTLVTFLKIWFSSVEFSRSVMSSSLGPHELQHARPPCPSPTLGAYPNSCPLSESVMPSNHLILCRPLLLLPSIFPSIRVFSNESALRIRWPNIGVSASTSVLPMTIQDCFPLGWTGMGEFNSDDHYIYFCGQESLRRNGVAIIVNKRVWNAVLGCNLKNNRMISVHFQGKPLSITVIQVYAPTRNAEEAEVEWFYEDLQDFLELTPQKMSFSL